MSHFGFCSYFWFDASVQKCGTFGHNISKSVCSFIFEEVGVFGVEFSYCKECKLITRQPANFFQIYWIPFSVLWKYALKETYFVCSIQVRRYIRWRAQWSNKPSLLECYSPACMHNQVSRDAYLRKQTVNILSAAKRSSHFRRQIFTKVRVNGAYSYFQNSTEAFSIIF